MGNPGNDRRIDNIEFAVSDIARSRAFYGKAFGWTFTDYGPTYCEFSDGRLTGGLAKGSPIILADRWSSSMPRPGRDAASSRRRWREDRQTGLRLSRRPTLSFP